MTDEIISFITRYVSLTEEEIAIIHEQNLIRSYRKDAVLLSEGEYAKECYFILQGCVRSYYLIDGEEKTTDFYTESQTITPISYTKKEPSKYFLSCLENSIIALGSTERNNQLLEKIPKLQSMVAQLNSELLMQKQVSFDDFKSLSPEQRYLSLLETRPDLFNRVPLYHIATYLGITPVSLSRMRKRVSVKVR
jgi:CRP-like cAMP-binding protein